MMNYIDKLQMNILGIKIDKKTLSNNLLKTNLNKFKYTLKSK